METNFTLPSQSIDIKSTELPDIEAKSGPKAKAKRSGPSFLETLTAKPSSKHASNNSNNNKQKINNHSHDIKNNKDKNKNSQTSHLSPKHHHIHKQNLIEKTDNRQSDNRRSENIHPTGKINKNITNKNIPVNQTSDQAHSDNKIPDNIAPRSQIPESTKKVLKLLEKIIGKGSQLINSTPVLSFLNGKLEKFDPSSITSFVTTNKFLNEAISSNDIPSFLNKPFQLNKLLNLLDIKIDEDLPKDLGVISLSPNQFFNALDINPDRVNVELTILKDNLSVDGLNSYIIRAAKLRAQQKAASSFDANSTNKKVSNQPDDAQTIHIRAPQKNQDAVLPVSTNPQYVEKTMPISSQVASPFNINDSNQHLPVAPNKHFNELAKVSNKNIFNKKVNDVSFPALPKIKEALKDPFLDINLSNINTVKKFNLSLDQNIFAEKAAIPSLPDNVLDKDIENIKKPLPEDIKDTSLFRDIPFNNKADNIKGINAKKALVNAMNDVAIKDVTIKDIPQNIDDVIPQEIKNNDSFIYSPKKISDINSTAAEGIKNIMPEKNTVQSPLNFTKQNTIITTMADSSSSGFNPKENSQDFTSDKSSSQNISHIRGENSNNFKPLSTEFLAKTPTSNIESHNIVNKILKHANMLLKQGGGAIKLDLGSKDLGDLKIALNVNHNSVDLKILSGSEHVRDLLSNQLGYLKEALSQHNLQLRDVEVGVGGGSTWAQSNNSGGFSWGGDFQQYSEKYFPNGSQKGSYVYKYKESVGPTRITPIHDGNIQVLA